MAAVPEVSPVLPSLILRGSSARYHGPRSGNYKGLIVTRKVKAADKYGGMRISSIGVKPGWENSKYKVERGFRFVLLRIKLLTFLSLNGFRSGFRKADTPGCCLLFDDDGSGWTRTPPPELR